MTVVLSNDGHFIDDHFTLLVNNNIFLKKIGEMTPSMRLRTEDMPLS